MKFIVCDYLIDFRSSLLVSPCLYVSNYCFNYSVCVCVRVCAYVYIYIGTAYPSGLAFEGLGLRLYCRDYGFECY
jgi:hypothetical protein